MAYLIAVGLAVATLIFVAAKLSARRDVRGEVERFHRAREITTNWSQQHTGVTRRDWESAEDQTA